MTSISSKTRMTFAMSAFAVCSVPLVAVAANYYFQSGKTDFSKTGSYLVDGVEPKTLPTGDDLVYLPSGANIEVDAPSASFSAIASVNRIVPAGLGSLVVNVANASDECAMSSAFAAGNAGNDYYKGRLVKRGLGTLTLASSATVNSTSGYAYYAHIDVAGGVLKLPDHASGTRYYGQIAVSNGATLFTSGAASSQLQGLFGAGVVTNASDSTSHSISIKCAWESSIRDGVNFSGAIGGRISLTSNGCGSLTGENSTFSGNMMVNHIVETSAGGIPLAKYILGVKSFGMANGPSSIGTNGVVQTGTRGGRFKYLGTGETTDKEFAVRQDQLNNSGVPFEIDGGTIGGLVIEGGKITSPYIGVGSYIPRMLLTGSHTNACVMAVPVNAGSLSFHVKKTGSGRWDFLRAAKDSTSGGAFTIEEGELGYDSLAPAGKQCAFGYATNLCEFVSAQSITASIRIPYAFRLGSDGKTAALDYVGTNRVDGSGRLTGLAGTGRFTTSGEKCSEVFFDGVSAIGEGAQRTLVLDGNVGTNTFANVTNGEGVVSVVKRGAGTWVIEKETSFSGTLAVEGGTLIVRAPDAPYSWHRFTIRSTWGSGFPSLKEFAMYNTSGARCNKGLVCDHRSSASSGSTFGPSITPKNNAMELDPGHATFSDGRLHKVGYNSEDLPSVFDDNSSSRWFEYVLGTNGQAPTEGTPARWIKFTMRQKTDAGEVVAYDMVETHSTASGKVTYPVKTYMIEGSQDGVEWTTLTNATYGIWNEDTQTYADPTSELTANKWYSNMETFAANRSVGEDEGFRIPGRPEWNGPAALANVSQVFVTSNAVLQAEGSVSIGSIVVDCASGGTINGFTMRSSGSLSLVNVPKINGGRYALPISFEGVSDLGNLANWSLSIDGVVKAPGAAHVVVDNGSAYLVRSGLLIIFN